MGWTLGVAFGAVLIALIWRVRKPGLGGDGAAVEMFGTYRIHGGVELRNDCDGGVGALPTTIAVTAVLTDGQRARKEARCEVDLTEAGDADGEGPDLVGQYALEMEWSGRRAPAYWDPPRATLVGGGDICDGPGCLPNTRCVNLASRPRRIQADERDQEFTLRVTCICVPQ